MPTIIFGKMFLSRLLRDNLLIDIDSTLFIFNLESFQWWLIIKFFPQTNLFLYFIQYLIGKQLKIILHIFHMPRFLWNLWFNSRFFCFHISKLISDVDDIFSAIPNHLIYIGTLLSFVLDEWVIIVLDVIIEICLTLAGLLYGLFLQF